MCIGNKYSSLRIKVWNAKIKFFTMLIPMPMPGCRCQDFQRPKNFDVDIMYSCLRKYSDCVMILIVFAIVPMYCVINFTFLNFKFCKIKLDAFCNKLYSHFVIKSLSHFAIKYYNERIMKS